MKAKSVDAWYLTHLDWSGAESQLTCGGADVNGELCGGKLYELQCVEVLSISVLIASELAGTHAAVEA